MGTGSLLHGLPAVCDIPLAMLYPILSSHSPLMVLMVELLLLLKMKPGELKLRQVIVVGQIS